MRDRSDSHLEINKLAKPCRTRHRFRRHVRGLAIVFTLAASNAALADSANPPDAGLIDIKSAYDAKGDGVTDDTGAIVQAIRDSVGERDHIIYFPAGTYLVSAPLEWKDANGNWCAYLSFQGESRDATVIKLRNNASGYSDSNNPRAVIYTASNVGTANARGTGNEGFRNNIFSLTVDTGSGNPGAIGIDYLAHNQARIADVTIQSGDGKGAVGLSLTRRWIGPMLATNLLIKGFDLGISLAEGMSSATLEHLTLQNQRVAGLRNSDNIVSIRDLTSSNSVPAVQNVSWAGLITLLDAELTGGSGSVSAIQNTSGVLYARNVHTRGYLSAINNAGSIVSGADQKEFASKSISGLVTSPAQTSLNLPIEETPQFNDGNLANWANVTSYGAVANDLRDDTAAIQAAIDSGQTTVYLPPGDYRLSDTIHIRGNVRRIIGFGARISPISIKFPATKPALRMESTDVPFVVLERLAVTENYSVPQYPSFTSVVEHAAGVLVLKDMMAITYKALPGAGNVFLEDVCCGPFEFNRQNAWARQLDSETGETHVRNVGGNLWILGLKTEQVSTIVETTEGGQTELLGGFISIWQNITTVPAFINTDSTHSLVFATSADYKFNVAVQETHNGATISIPSTTLPKRNLGVNVPLYSGPQ